ncbi:MAG: MFS transporter [Actinobacteria bacterium]|nr:MFS transporter [Actinomycetota bacterium]
MIEIAGIEIASQAIVSGLVSGLIYAAFAAGFVLIYRSTGVLNFAQGEQGAFGLALFVLLNANYDVPWWAAFVLAVVGSAVVGALIELLVVRRLFSSPRLVLLIATIGVGQILLLARVAWIPDINDFNAIPTAVSFVWEPTNSLRIDARQTSVIFIVPLLVVALGVFGYARHASSVPDPVVRPRHLFATRFRSVHTTSLLAVGGALGFHSFLPVYLNGVRGLSTTAAAFSVAYLSAGWTAGAVSSSRLQDRILREQVVLIGSVVLSIGILLSTVLVWAEAPVAVLAIGLFISGLGTGAISTTGINVLQERTPLSEMGRVNGAHQFTRSMSVTYGVGIAGAVILTTVDRRTGDVEAVRDLLGGDVETVSRPVADALGAGFLFAIAVAAVAAVTTIPAARHLVRSRPEAVTSAA